MTSRTEFRPTSPRGVAARVIGIVSWYAFLWWYLNAVDDGLVMAGAFVFMGVVPGYMILRPWFWMDRHEIHEPDLVGPDSAQR